MWTYKGFIVSTPIPIICTISYILYVYFTLDKWHLNIKLTLREEVARPALCWMITLCTPPGKPWASWALCCAVFSSVLLAMGDGVGWRKVLTPKVVQQNGPGCGGFFCLPLPSEMAAWQSGGYKSFRTALNLRQNLRGQDWQYIRKRAVKPIGVGVGVTTFGKCA